LIAEMILIIIETYKNRKIFLQGFDLFVEDLLKEENLVGIKK